MIVPVKPGLTRLDQVREASMADEGGTAGAWIESEEFDERGPTLVRRSYFSKPSVTRQATSGSDLDSSTRPGPRTAIILCFTVFLAAFWVGRSRPLKTKATLLEAESLSSFP